MKKAEFPQRTCREPVWGEVQAYSCELPDLHPGPCASYSVKDSVERRNAWEGRNPGWEERIGDSTFMATSGNEAPPK